jgi:2-amino-4-hydroxy-6-hydroxymethyldihydropteridine diphosphokinase
MLGSNAGNRKDYLDRSIDLVNHNAGTITGMSSVYESEPWGFDDPVWFLNQAIALETHFTPQALLKCTQQIEQILGRTRTNTGYQARTIDIDILLYGECVINTPDLVIPHPRMTERLFVLQPMAELAPDLEHPALKLKMKDLRESCNDSRIVHDLA